jgi:hypothetical protein
MSAMNTDAASAVSEHGNNQPSPGRKYDGKHSSFAVFD